MLSNNYPFGFDINFDFGTESVFTQSNKNNTTFVPLGPVFKLLDGSNFLLLDGSNLELL